MSTYISASVLLDDESTFTPRTTKSSGGGIASVNVGIPWQRLDLQTSDPDSFRRLAGALIIAAGNLEELRLQVEAVPS